MLVVDITAAGAAGSRLGRYKVLERRRMAPLCSLPSLDEVIAETAERPLSGAEFLDALERLDTVSSQRP